MSSGNGHTQGMIVGADGIPATLPVLHLSPEDAILLRAYKKFLQRYHLKEALFCNQCWTGKREDGLEAHVTDTHILLRCRCAMRVYAGQMV